MINPVFVHFAAPRVLPARPTTRRVSLPVSLALMGLLFSVPPKNAVSSPDREWLGTGLARYATTLRTELRPSNPS
jgi:hypothetical protein